MSEYCCEDFKIMMEEHIVDKWSDGDLEWMKSRFTREKYSIREDVDWDEFGALFIRYCPRCGARL